MYKDFILFVYFVIMSLGFLVIRYLYYEESLLCYGCREIKPSYDYIIVGAGTAGSVVAKRLAGNSSSVLVLEAGSRYHSLLSIPSVGLLLHRSEFDWKYRTTKQKNACNALKDNKCNLPQGKIVGGSHMLNNLIYTRGHKEDYAEWFEDLPNYSFEKDVLPYFERAEHIPNKNGTEKETKGPAYVGTLNYFSTMTDTIIDGFRKLGYFNSTATLDYFGGMFRPFVNIKNGQRWTTAHHLLEKKLSILTLITRITAQKILFRNNFEAYAVQVDYFGKKYFIKANKAVIVCAGAVGSPHLLMLSGIGPEDHLKSKGIQVIKDLPVGENLQDHPITGFDMLLLNSSVNMGIEDFLSPYSLWQYLFYGTGIFTTQGCELIGFTNLKYTHCKNKINRSEQVCVKLLNERPDFETMFIPTGVSADRGVILKNFLGIKDDIWNNYFDKINDTAISLMEVLLHPKSRGTVRLLNKNPNTKPLIDPNYLGDEKDVYSFLSSYVLLRKFVDTPQSREKHVKLNTIHFPKCKEFEFGTFCYWKCYLRHMTVSCYHLAGTCKMGLEEKGGVVDFNFRVHKTNKLFVVDASVLPNLPSGHINGPVIMMAERASDAIKKYAYLETGHSFSKDVFKPEV